MSQKLEISGTVVFLRGRVASGDKSCACCGSKGVPHAHVFSERVTFPAIPSLFIGLADHSIQEYLHRFIHLNWPQIEGKTVKVTFEVEEK